MTDHFNTILRDTLNKHAPEQLHSIRLRPNSPWFSDDLRKLKRERRLCERKFKSTNLEIHRQLYKDACRTYTTALNSVKTGCYREKISCASNDQLFKMINGLFRVKALQPLPSHESLSTLAETFSNYFHSKIEKMRSKLEQSDYITNDLLINEQPSICQSTFLEFNQVSESFVSELIIKASGKSCTLDPVPAAILKRNVAELLSASVATIINTSLASGVFPKALKQGLVRPSIKKPTLDKEAYLSYRPITNTVFVSKLLE